MIAKKQQSSTYICSVLNKMHQKQKKMSLDKEYFRKYHHFFRIAITFPISRPLDIAKLSNTEF